MWPCRIVDRLIRIFPFKAGQDFFIRHHVSGCTTCSEMLAAKEEVRAVMIQEQDLLGVEDFWPEVKRQRHMSPKNHFLPQVHFWKWISVATALIVMLLTSLWLYRGFRGEGEVNPHPKLWIDYVKIEEKPAHAYIFKPQGADMTLVWVEKNGEGE